MDINDIEKLKEELDKNNKANIAAVERVLERMREATNRPAAVIQTPRLGEKMPIIIERIIKNHGGNFAICDVAHKYKETTGKWASDTVRKEISNCINKLKHRNPAEIDVVQAGRGSRSGVYKMRTS